MSNIARLVSVVNASGSTWTKVRPPAENVETSSADSSWYCVSSAPIGNSSWYANSGMGQKVPCSEEDLMTESQYRVEHDSMGEVRVPADALWGAQTQRAVENFPISGRPIAAALVRSLAVIKAEAARVNRLDRPMQDAISAAAEEVVNGTYDDQFPIDVFQTGSGTSSNMNANEVIARIAAE